MTTRQAASYAERSAALRESWSPELRARSDAFRRQLDTERRRGDTELDEDTREWVAYGKRSMARILAREEEGYLPRERRTQVDCE